MGWLTYLVERTLGRWMVYWHGRGEAWQYQFYRCHGCRKIVTHQHIKFGGCPCAGSVRVSPAKLTRLEKARILFLPWTVTRPGLRDVRDAERAQ